MTQFVASISEDARNADDSTHLIVLYPKNDRCYTAYRNTPETLKTDPHYAEWHGRNAAEILAAAYEYSENVPGLDVTKEYAIVTVEEATAAIEADIVKGFCLIEQVDEGFFWSMREYREPLEEGGSPDFEWFLMPEFIHNNEWTDMYAKNVSGDGKPICLRKTVKYGDKSTYITPMDFLPYTAKRM